MRETCISLSVLPSLPKAVCAHFIGKINALVCWGRGLSDLHLPYLRALPCATCDHVNTCIKSQFLGILVKPDSFSSLKVLHLGWAGPDGDGVSSGWLQPHLKAGRKSQQHLVSLQERACPLQRVTHPTAGRTGDISSPSAHRSAPPKSSPTWVLSSLSTKTHPVRSVGSASASPGRSSKLRQRNLLPLCTTCTSVAGARFCRAANFLPYIAVCSDSSLK